MSNPDRPVWVFNKEEVAILTEALEKHREWEAKDKPHLTAFIGQTYRAQRLTEMIEKIQNPMDWDMF